MKHNNAALPFLMHLKELKKRLLAVVVMWGICTGVSYSFSEQIFEILLRPFLWAIKGGPEHHKLIYISMPEAFITYVKVALFSGFFISFPFFLFQLWLFIKPGLRAEEKNILRPFIAISPVLFILGAGFAYFFVIPLAFEFFLSFENPSSMALPLLLEARMSEYFSLTISFLCAFGFAFEFPLVLLGLSQIDLLKASTLQKNRKYAIILILIVAAILTPPDILSQILLAIPLILLYEGTILLMVWQEKKKSTSTKRSKKRVSHV